MRTHEERRAYLIRYLQAEPCCAPALSGIPLPPGEEDRQKLLRALMNVRPPLPISADFLAVQDAYLKEETARRGVVDAEALPAAGGDGRLALWRGDITRLRAGAIVNAANSALLGCFRPLHACIDNAIHTNAGVRLRLACDELMRAQGSGEPPGRAKLTPGFNLPCAFVLHTVGPIVAGELRESDCALLADCYRSCLAAAAENGIGSVAFCCISTGVFRFPQDRAAKIAVDTVSCFLQRDTSIRRVVFDVFTDRDLALYRELLQNQSEAIG